MRKITVGLTCSFVFAVAGVVACSSTATNDKGTAGNGAIVGGSANTGGVSSGGVGTGTAGSGRAGNASTAGTATGGTGGGCAAMGVTCVDATMATGCNPDTGVVETFSCVEELKAIGIVSMGCTKGGGTDANGNPTVDHCSIDDFSDAACVDGTAAYSFCENLTDAQTLNVYINCFLDNNMAHTVIPCFSTYVTPMMMTGPDCRTAEAACIPGLGQGGAGPDAAGGAGGAGP